MTFSIGGGFEQAAYSNKGNVWPLSRLFGRPSKDECFEAFKIGNLPAERLSRRHGRADRVIFHLHGGGYLVKLMDLYRFAARRYLKASQGATVLTIDYRTAPEHTFPAALEDALMAWDWLLNKGYSEEQMIVIGDSGGAHLATTFDMCLRDRGRTLPKALILLSPWLDLTASGPFYKENRFRDPIFGLKKEGETFVERYNLLFQYFANQDIKAPYISPIFGDFHGFPNTLIQVGSDEILLSDAITFYEKATKVGVNATLSIYDGIFHTFQILTSFLPESKKAWNEIQAFIESQW